MNIKKNDKIMVLSGKDKGKKGKVLRVMPKTNKVLVEGINIIKKHQRPSQNFKGGIIDRPAAMNGSKVMVVCPRCNKPARIGRKLVEEKMVRFCKKCSEVVDKI